MFERYTESARRAIFFGRYEAGQEGSPFIESQHLLLGILHDADVARRLFRSTKIVERIRLELTSKTAPGKPRSTAGDLPLSHQCRRILAFGAEEAEKLRQRHINTAHLLIGMLRESDSAVARLLLSNGISEVRLRAEAASSEAPPEATKEKPAPDFIDATSAAAEGALDPLVGRERELDRIIEILSRRHKNCVALIGEPGVGKTAIIDGLAQRIAAGEVPPAVQGRQLLRLSPRTGLSRRAVREGLPIVVLEGLFDSDSTATAAVAREAAHSQLQAIATGTPAGYRNATQDDTFLARIFEPVEVVPPSEGDAAVVLRALQPRYEKFHGITYGEGVIEAALRASAVFLNHRFLPDRALDLIDEAGARVAIKGGRNLVVPDDIEEAAAARAGISAAAVKILLQRPAPWRIQVVKGKLGAAIPAEGHEWIALLADYLAHCTKADAERLADAIRGLN